MQRGPGTAASTAATAQPREQAAARGGGGVAAAAAKGVQPAVAAPPVPAAALHEGHLFQGTEDGAKHALRQQGQQQQKEREGRGGTRSRGPARQLGPWAGELAASYAAAARGGGAEHGLRSKTTHRGGARAQRTLRPATVQRGALNLRALLS